LKKITGDEDFGTAIMLLFMFSMLFVWEIRDLMKNLSSHGSIIITEPILFADNSFKTLGNFLWFLIPATIVLAAIKEKHLFLKLTYFLGSVPLVLTAPIINKLGFKSLYVVKVLIMFAVTMCLIKWLGNTTELYKKAVKPNDSTDNQATARDGSQTRRP
jgi:hypothetical protein